MAVYDLIKGNNRYQMIRSPKAPDTTGASSQSGTPTPTAPVDVVSTTLYDSDGNAVELRSVGTYADSYDADTHTITRNVGVKVFDGTEGWQLNGGVTRLYQLAIADSKAQLSEPYYGLCTHFTAMETTTAGNLNFDKCTFQAIWGGRVSFRYYTENNSVSEWKAWVASQYSAETPVTVYYPLTTPTTESKALYGEAECYNLIRS